MLAHDPFYIQKGSIYAIPIVHYNMEMASQVKIAFETIKPDCIAVELPETMQTSMLHAASRLPDISLVLTHNKKTSPLYFLCEPCEPTFEALRSATENNIAAYCIDLDIDDYPDNQEWIPDSYAIQRLGLKVYYELYEQVTKGRTNKRHPLDIQRETHMARRLKELSLSYDRVLFVGGMAHIHPIMQLIDKSSFPIFSHAQRDSLQVCTLTPESCREIMVEWPYLTLKYEERRNEILQRGPLDRQKTIFQLYKEASEKYIINTGNQFPG